MRARAPFSKWACTRVTTPPLPPKRGAHAHAVRLAYEPRCDKLRAGLVQVGDTGHYADEVHDEAGDLPAVRPQASAIGADHAEATDVQGAAPQVLQGVVRLMLQVQGVLLGGGGGMGSGMAACT